MTKIISLLLISLTLLGLTGCSSSPYEPGLRPPVREPGHIEARFDGVGAVNLFSQSWHPLTGPTKAAVIIVHGLKDHSSRYAVPARRLAENSYAVYAYDHRGHGDSAGQRVWVDSFDDYVTDLETFYDQVRKEQPGKPIYIFGHSMGGAIVTLFALKNSRPVKGLILSGPALKAGEDINKFLIQVTNILGSLFPTLAVLELEDEAFSRDADVVKAIKADPLVYHGKGPAKTAKEVLNAIDRIQTQMSEVNVPFLVMHGEKDVLTNPDGSRELYERAKVKDKTLKLYPNTFHDLLHEPEQDQIFSDMLHWLNMRTDSL